MRVTLLFLSLLFGMSQSLAHASELMPADSPPKGEFSASVLGTRDTEEARSGFNAYDAVPLARTVARGKKVGTLLLISGCAPDASGTCHVSALITSTRPDGAPWGNPGEVRIFDGPASDLEGKWFMWTGEATGSFDAGEPIGPYLISYRVTDEVAQQTLIREWKFEASEEG